MESTYIPFVSIEQGPRLPLHEKLTIGSEIGDYIYGHDSIAPRHCSLILEKGVISIVDHGSQVGTFINQQKLSAGKKYIINENDQMTVGKVPLHIGWPENSYKEESEEKDYSDLLPEHIDKTEVTGVTKLMGQLNAKTQSEDGPPVFDEKTLTGFRANIDYEEVELNPEVLEKAKLYNNRGVKLRGKVLKHTNSAQEKIENSGASHFVLRCIAVLFDILICISILNVFYVFIDFQNFYNEVPKIIGEFLKPLYELSLAPFLSEYLQEGKALSRLLEDITSFKHYEFLIGLFFFYFLERISTTLLFGVSLGQALVGLKGGGSSFVKRCMGAMREMISFFTWPLLLGTIPSLVSKRTFKEYITRTIVITRSTLLSIILVFVSGVVLVSLATLTPIIKGGVFLAPISVEKKSIEKNAKTFENSVYSQFFHLDYELNQRFQTLPSFEVEQKEKKRVLSLGLAYIDAQTGVHVKLKKLKEFKFTSLYSDFLKLNFLSEKRFPQIYSSVHSAGNFNENFSQFKANVKKLGDETLKILDESFNLSLQNLPKLIIENGPFISGHRDFKEKVMNLIGKKIKRVEIIEWGEQKGAVFVHEEGSEKSYTFMPVGYLLGSLYSLSVNPLNPKYTLLISSMKFNFNQNQNKNKQLDPIEKFVESFKDKKNEDFELAQLVYERYFMLGRMFLDKDIKEGISFLKYNVGKIIEVLQENNQRYVKLILNLTELNTALENRNFEFFQISKTKAI